MKHSEAFEALVAEIMPQVDEIDREATAVRVAEGSAHLIDVREDHEWAASRIPGAQHIGRGIIERDIEKHFPDAEAPLILYCGGGYRSALAALNLTKMGYKNVKSMAGGIRGWRDDGRELDETNGG